MKYHKVAEIPSMVATDSISIDSRFEELLLPLSANERLQLEQNIADDGCLDPLKVAILNGCATLIDGHNRFEICTRLNVPYKTETIDVPSWEAAYDWIINNQLGRRNVTPEQTSYLRGKRYLREKQSHGGEREPSGQNVHLGKTAEVIAAEYNVNEKTIRRDAAFAVAVDAIGSSKGDDCRREILSGETGLTKQDVVRLADMPQEQSSPIIEKVRSGEAKTFHEAVKKLRKQAVGLKESDETCTVTDLTRLIGSGRKFGTIYLDPPWSYGNQATRSSTDNHYVTMSIDDIAALPVSELAADQSHIYLWTTNAFLHDSFHLLEKWGFEYKSMLIWDKNAYGIGNYWRLQHEFLMLGIRNNLRVADSNNRSIFRQDPTGHSAKPEAIRKMIEGMSPGPYLEMFARRIATGWTCWGNEITRTMFDSDVKEVA